MHIVPLYAALLALMFTALSVRTLRLRRILSIAIGDSGNQVLLRAMRVHSNFAEYIPLSLFLLFLVESKGASAFFVHLLGLALLVGRASHAYGVSHTSENYRFRVIGMALTLSTLLASSAFLLRGYL